MEQFAFVAAHDLKSPLNNISSIAELLSEHYAPALDKDANTMLSHIKTSSEKLTGLIDGLLDYSRSETILHQEKSIIDLQEFRNEIFGLFSYDNSLSLSLKSSLDSISMNKAALDQIVINLISNAIKYSDKDEVIVEIGATEREDYFEFYVLDNGPGIPDEHQDAVFQIFKVLANTDKFGRKGNGIGLATVKKLIERLGGTIKLSSKPGEGCKFTFQIKKYGTVVEEALFV